MKQITKTTILHCGDKTYQPVQNMDGSIFWEDTNYQIVAQSQPRIEGIPVVSLDSYVNELTKLDLIHLIKIVQKSEDYKSVMGINLENTLKRLLSNYKSNPNQYTQKDIDKAIELSKEQPYFNKNGNRLSGEGYFLSTEEILEQISQIEIIHIDGQFNILSYE